MKLLTVMPPGVIMLHLPFRFGWEWRREPKTRLAADSGWRHVRGLLWRRVMA